MSLKGVIPPVVTPLNEDGTFDAESFTRVIEHMLGAGVHGLFVLGSSGEVAFSTDERRDEVTRRAVEVVVGRAPVLVGVIDTQTERVIAHVKRAEAIGVDGLVVTAPFYGLGGEAEVERHFRYIAQQTKLPIFAYDLPVSVHTKLSGDMLVRLGVEGVLAGVKDSSGDDVAFRQLILKNRAAGSPLTLLTGHEVVVDGAYLGGADGAVPGLGNIDPAGYVRMWDAYQDGNWEAVRGEQDRLVEVMGITSAVTGVTGFGAGVGAFKTALHLMGLIKTNKMPEPVRTLEGENVEAIAAVLRQTGLID